MTLPKAKYWYHGTSIEAIRSILDDGFLRSSGDGIYFTNTSNNAGTFCAMRGLSKYAVIKVPRQVIVDRLLPSHDHGYHLPVGCYFAVYTGDKVAVTDDMVEFWENE
jgi:hypothetical protein